MFTSTSPGCMENIRFKGNAKMAHTCTLSSLIVRKNGQILLKNIRSLL